MGTSYLDCVDFVKKAIVKSPRGSICRGGLLLGGLAFLLGCNNMIKGGTAEIQRQVVKETMSVLAQNLSVNQNGPEKLVTLPYKSRGGGIPVFCELESLVKVTESTPCACNEKVCSVGIRPEANAHGEGSFAFRLIDRFKVPSILGNVKVKILPVTVSIAPDDSGNGQTGTVGTELSKPLVAFVKNINGEPVKGVEVFWKVPDKEGKLSSCKRVSNDEGKAQCNWTLGTEVGVDGVFATHHVKVSIFDTGRPAGQNAQPPPPPPTAEFTATVKSGPAVRLIFSKGDYPKPRSVAGKMGPIRIYPQDEHGNLAEIQNSSNNLKITLSFKKEPKGEWVLPEKPDQAMTFPWKGGTFSELSLEKVGVYTLKANISGPGSDLNNLETFGEKFEVIPAQATKLVFAQQPGGGIAGAIWTQQPKVQAQDSYENKIPDFASKVKLRIERVGGDPKANTLEREVSADPGVGIATFTDLKINEAGQYILKASSSSLPEVESDPFTITPAMANKLVFTQSPSGCVAGTTWAQQPQVTLQDSYGNEVKSPSVSVTVIIRTSTGDNPIQLPGGTTTLATVNGVASFEGLSFEQAGDYTLTAISSGLFSGISEPFLITPGHANKLSFIEEPKDGKAGEALAPLPKVAIQDKYGNQISCLSDVNSCSPDVKLVLETNSSGGVLSATDKANVVDGIATVKADKAIAAFPNLSIKKAGEGYTLKASASGLKEAKSSAFNITSGAAAQLAFTTQPVGGTAGTAWNQQPVVTIQDDLGNTVTSSSANVTLAIGTNNGEGRLSGTTTVSASNGVATFAGLSINKSGKGYTLTASSDGLSATSSKFDIITGAPTQLAFTTQPGGGTAGTAWNQQPVVTVQDGFGNTASSSANVTLAIGANPGKGSLSGTTAVVSASSGVATFTGLSIEKSGTAYTLTASSNGLEGATSSVFNITHGVTDRLVFTTQPGDAKVGTPFTIQPVVAIQDAHGNNITSGADAVTYLTISLASGTGTLSGTTKKVFATLGVASWSGLSIDAFGSKILQVNKPDLTTSPGGTASLSVSSIPFNNSEDPPPVPIGLVANARDKSVALRWTASSGATSYNILRGTSAGSLTPLATSNTNSYTDDNASNGTIYFYAIQSSSPGGTSANSSSIQAEPLSVPSISSLAVNDTAGAGALVLSWSASAGASKYEVKYSTKSGSTSSGTPGCTVTVFTCTIGGLTPNTTYYFTVNATNTYSGSVSSLESSGIPRAIPTLSLTPGHKQITPVFSSTGATSFNLFYGTSAGSYSTTGAGTSGTAITGLVNRTVYYFKVVANFSNGSLSSTELSKAPNGPQPFKITSATPGNTKVALVWDRSAGETGYVVKYGTSSNDYLIFKKEATAASVTVTGLTNGTTYYFMVTAENANGSQDADAEFVSTPALPTLSVLTDQVYTPLVGSSSIDIPFTLGGLPSFTCNKTVTASSSIPELIAKGGSITLSGTYPNCKLTVNVGRHLEGSQYSRGYDYGITLTATYGSDKTTQNFTLTLVGPAAAYSTRLVVLGYTGKSMLVRHGTNNALADVAFDSTDAVSASSNVTITSAGTSGWSLDQTMPFSAFYSEASVFVQTWYDQSGYGNNATQTSLGKQPAIVTSGTLEEGITFVPAKENFFNIPYATATSPNLYGGSFIATVLSQTNVAANGAGIFSSMGSFGIVPAALLALGNKLVFYIRTTERPTAYETTTAGGIQTLYNQRMSVFGAYEIHPDKKKYVVFGFNNQREETYVTLAMEPPPSPNGDTFYIGYGAAHKAYFPMKLNEIILYSKTLLVLKNTAYSTVLTNQKKYFDIDY